MTMADTTIKRRPIRAALYGLMLGISIWYFLQFQFASFALDSVTGVATRAVIVIVATMLLAVVWAYLAPARKPKGAAPAPGPAAPGPEAAAAPSPTIEEAASDLPSEDE
ncbi:MAG: hypothetical protein KJ698_06535 [Actinobacteria bacterium]|nr:hypothetical protein [Actinomycetota bacterium]